MIKFVLYLASIAVLASPFVHPFGAVRRQRSSSLLQGVVPDNSSALPLIERACQNCHSERTQWPLYSDLPLFSWAIEKDVSEARRHMDLSHWPEYSVEQRRDLLARMGSEVRNRRMPLPRYLFLHPEARLSEAEIQIIYEWTKAQRRALKSHRE